MTAEKNTKPWYRFFDGNKKYDYKSLYNAVLWAQRKVITSTSEQIRIYRLEKKGRALELDFIARVLYNRPSPSRVVEDFDSGEMVTLDPTDGSVTTVWHDMDVYNEYKEKEEWVSSER